jgi:hypothetical protein
MAALKVRGCTTTGDHHHHPAHGTPCMLLSFAPPARCFASALPRKRLFGPKTPLATVSPCYLHSGLSSLGLPRVTGPRVCRSLLGPRIWLQCWPPPVLLPHSCHRASPSSPALLTRSPHSHRPDRSRRRAAARGVHPGPLRWGRWAGHRRCSARRGARVGGRRGAGAFRGRLPVRVVLERRKISSYLFNSVCRHRQIIYFNPLSRNLCTVTHTHQILHRVR